VPRGHRRNRFTIRLADDRGHLLFRKALRIAPSESEASLSTYRWSENPAAGHSRPRKLLQRACAIAARRELADATLRTDAYQLDAKLDALLRLTRSHAAGRKLQVVIKGCRRFLFVFLANRAHDRLGYFERVPLLQMCASRGRAIDAATSRSRSRARVSNAVRQGSSRAL
jgi:hypothetical protein